MLVAIGDADSKCRAQVEFRGDEAMVRAAGRSEVLVKESVIRRKGPFML
jgi:hypothetical protein